MSAFISIILFLAAASLVVNTLQLNKLRAKLREVEGCYDIATAALSVMSRRKTRAKYENLEEEEWIKAAVKETTREQFEEKLKELYDE